MNTELLSKYYKQLNNKHNIKKEIINIIAEYQKFCNSEYKIQSIVVKELEKLNFQYNENIIKLLASDYAGLDEKIDNYFINDLKEEDLATYFLMLIVPLKNIYLASNIPLIIFYNTLEDLFFHINKNFLNTNKITLTANEGNWLLRIFHLKIFKLGHLQYEKVNLLTKNKLIANLFQQKNISHKENVLAIHIMKNAKLTTNNMQSSFEQANKFFKEYSDLYYCYSWLLFEPMLNILKENSNILNFSSNFKIIENIYDNSKAIPRILNNKKETVLTKLLEKDNSKLGIGLGIFYSKK